MAHWREEYAAALATRDRREKANVVIYNAYTQLADRTASAVVTSNTQSAAQRSTPSTPIADPRQQPSPASGPFPQDILSATRADLAEAQRSRSELQERLARATTELERLRKRNNQDGRRIYSMEGEITHLQLRLKDRDEELREKAKLLEGFQDEIATFELQLNMAEERSNRLQKENQELVDRWMARMGKEADAMNDAYKFS
ncbi:ATG16 family protein [Aspergillus mulundensis]|uniref:Autophagy protein 16 n=1 Tax=Aspergillus mulundensis TaxID=1810919 RepID=A0A3D8QMH6_9EURO|nr:Autophagy protein 16 [Aspergillus mulundensis]RDW62977.1 Autophagy protein 16 [Aspergillus mulundensis]